MQAQVEPHFLFNTLANVRRLFQTDPDGARAMLDAPVALPERHAAANAQRGVDARA